MHTARRRIKVAGLHDGSGKKETREKIADYRLVLDDRRENSDSAKVTAAYWAAPLCTKPHHTICTPHHLYTTRLRCTAPAEEFKGCEGLPAMPVESHDTDAL
jgi:hypothetical protein